MQYKSAEVKAKAEREDGTLSISFYASVFGNVDSWNDVVVPTAYDNFLKSEDAQRVKLCYQHDVTEVIGVIKSMQVDEVGLLVEAEVLPTAKGKDVALLLKAGAINEFSIGYYATKYHFENKGEGDVRFLDEVVLYEISPVSHAANPKAVLLDAKSDDFDSALKTASFEELESMKQAIEAEQMTRYAAVL